MIGSVAVFSLPRLCLAALARCGLALVIWSGFSVFQDGRGTSAQVTSAYDLRQIKDLKSVSISVEAFGSSFAIYHYSLSIHGDGIVEFYGHYGTSIPGLHRWHLSEAEVLQLLGAFRAADFYSLHDESGLLFMDAPSFTIALSADGHSTSVTDQSGESKAFRALMDRILEISHAQGTSDTLQALLADAENLNTTDDEGRTVLMWACENADVAAARVLIRFGADVRAKDKHGRTVLMYAAARQSAEIVDALLHSQADLGEKDSAGETVVHFSAGLASSSNLLVPMADYTEPPTASFWPSVYLFLAPKPEPQVLAILLAAGANPNAADFEGATPLMYAAESATPEVLRALLAAGADLNAQDARGRTALMYAADHCQTESAQLLVQRGADVTRKDINGYTALKRVRRKPSKSRRTLCGTSQKQIIRILQVGYLGPPAAASSCFDGIERDRLEILQRAEHAE